MPELDVAPSALPIGELKRSDHWSGRSLWDRIWNNRTVKDEIRFSDEFREHSFSYAYVTTWAAAIVGSITAIHRQHLARQPSVDWVDLLELYWIPLLLFSCLPLFRHTAYSKARDTFKSLPSYRQMLWAFYWAFDVLYAIYFCRVVRRLTQIQYVPAPSIGTQPTAEWLSNCLAVSDANISTVTLIVFTAIFLRLPFRHLFVLVTTATAMIDAVAIYNAGWGACFRLVVTSLLTLVLSLYANWGMERRDRGLFDKNLEAEANEKSAVVAATAADKAAMEAEAHRERAEQLAYEEQEHRMRAEHAAADAAVQRGRAEHAATEAERQRQHAQNAAAEAEAERARAENAASEEKRQRALAEQAVAEAEKQRRLAQELAKDAEEQRKRAEMAAEEERRQRERAESTAGEARDIADQKDRLHKEVTALYTQREELMRGLHHDANNSLFDMGAALRSLEHKVERDPTLLPLEPDLNALRASTRAISDLMGGIRELVEIGKFQPKYRAISVNGVLEYLRQRFDPIAAERNLEFRVTMRRDDIYVWSDEIALEHMLANFVSNALKYTSIKKDSELKRKRDGSIALTSTGKRGGVVVRTVRYGPSLRFDVWDTGVGIPAHKQALIFEEFVRLRPNEIDGLGVGLAVVKLFRDRLAGHYVEVSSKEGCGSRFSLSLQTTAPPRVVDDRNGEDSGTVVDLDVRKRYVVVVEDNPTVQESIGSTLRAAGYEIEDNVKFASSVSGAEEIFKRNPNRAPNIVVCDFTLQDGETANDVIRLVDAEFSWEALRIPIVVFSAEVKPRVVTDRPNIRVVTKSVEAKPLISAMASAIAESRRVLHQ